MEKLELSTGKFIGVDVHQPGYVPPEGAPLTDDELAEAAAKVASYRAKQMAKCREERQAAKDAMLGRNAGRMADLKAKGLIEDGETLEDYDERVASGG